MIDLNNDEYRKLLSDAGNSKDGKIIVEYLNNELSKLRFDTIDDKLPLQELALEYKVMKKTREYIKKCLIYLIGS